MPEFFVLNLRTQLPIRNAHDETILYASGAEASVAAAAYSDAMGDKCQPRPFQLDDNWQKREQIKLIDGTYQPLPWDRFAIRGYVEWYQEDFPAHYLPVEDYSSYNSQIKGNWFYAFRKKEAQYNFPHVSKKVKGNIAYTESADRGRRNIQTSIKPGRYIERFYTSLGALEIKRLANDFVTQFGELKLLFASTEQDLAMVFTHDFGPNSCMSYPPKDYVTGYSPVRAYAGSDLQVAYIAVCDDDGKPYRVSARCVVWPEKKLYSRIYGEDQKIIPLLKAQGYKYGYMSGAKLPKIEFEPGQYVMPYLDGHCEVMDNGDHWVICKEGDGDFTAQTTNGVLETERECPGCYLTRTPGNWPRVSDVDERWCPNCIVNHTFQCRNCGRIYSEAVESFTIAPSNVKWCQYCKEDNADFCDATKQYWDISNLVRVGDVFWNKYYFIENGMLCDKCYQNVPNEEYEGCKNYGNCSRHHISR